MAKGNRGEWSEFYALLKILSERRLYAADSNLVAIPDKYYSVLKVIREEAQHGRTTYDLTGEKGLVGIFTDGNQAVSVFDVSEIKPSITNIFAKMKDSEDTTFEIAGSEQLMLALHCTQIKASSDEKSDLFLVIHDRISPISPELGFSIKSMIGSASTLLNASGATNITYSIPGFSGNAEEINAMEGRSKMRDRITTIEENAPLVYEDVENDSFKKNMKKVDTVFPEIMAEILKSFFEGKGSSVCDLVDNLAENSTLKEKHGLSVADYEFKMKNFLVAAALGMKPGTEWDGFNKAHGGYIVVKEDGEIVCYHLYNREEFQEYLYRNTKLETPSTTRHDFGMLYEENGAWKIRLNLQIRFLK